MGGFRIKTDQSNEKACFNILDKAKRDKNKEENIKKFKNSLEEFYNVLFD